jgi:hypothetical protein
MELCMWTLSSGCGADTEVELAFLSSLIGALGRAEELSQRKFTDLERHDSVPEIMIKIPVRRNVMRTVLPKEMVSKSKVPGMLWMTLSVHPNPPTPLNTKRVVSKKCHKIILVRPKG